MPVPNVEVAPDVEKRLEQVAQAMGRSRDECAREAILDFLEDQEDYLPAVARLQTKEPGIPLAEVERRLGLVD